MLKALFTGEAAIPDNYYLGLDSRTSIVAADSMATVSAVEPSTGGYTRVAIPSAGEFTIETVGAVNRAIGPIASFPASGGSFGPVRNLFFTDKIDNSGYLISSVALSSPATVNSGEKINVRIAFSLKDCP